MTPMDHAAAVDAPFDRYGVVDTRTREVLDRRREMGRIKGRGWLVRRALVAADVLGLAAAFGLALALFGSSGGSDRVGVEAELAVFLVTVPAWIVLAKLYGLYERDEERADHSTVDDVAGVFHLTTTGAWLFFIGSSLTGLAEPQLLKLVTYWALATGLVTAGRAGARALCRTSVAYLQNTVIVGAGDVGQLVARKLLQHPEYGINLVGFVDREPKGRRRDLEHLALLGSPEELPEIVRTFDVERVVVSFSGEREEDTLGLIRLLRDDDVQIDVVPRLYEMVGPRVGIHTVEGLPLVGLPPTRLAPSSRLLKRVVDVVGASVGLVVAAPLLAYLALRIKRDSPGPILFRQKRLGMNMKEFTALKFRTMKVGTDPHAHRDYVAATMTASAALEENGVYKLDRSDAITPFGRWLRRTSLDELPQLVNVLRGDMSLVGPRPCLAYETESFAPHHFERFLVPAGMTGFWQVTARANSTFGEALEMDVAYARGWSLGLDVRLLLRTPIQVLRQRRQGTA